MVILVGGVGSTSTEAAVDRVDVGALGYDPADVYRFSYRGGRVPDSTDRAQPLPARPYDAQDSQSEMEVSGRRLHELIDELSALDPGVPIDIVAHSQGGLVARLALYDLASAGRTDVLGEVVTIGSPHQGADLATAAAAARTDSGASSVFGAIDDVVGGGLDLDSASVRQLAVGSSLTDRLRRSGVPDGVGVTSIGARGDLVVAANRTHLEGATNVTTALGGIDAHDALPSDPATTREIGLAIAGSPPTCESNGDIVLDVVGGRLVSHTEQVLAAGIFVAGLGVPG